MYKNLRIQGRLIRSVEEKIIELYPKDVIQSPVHLSIGQEAVAVGVCADLTSNDLLFTTYRSHAFYIAKGGDLNAFFAELYGKSTGCCKGKGGSMHLAYKSVGFMGTSAIVSSTIPHAVGAALANKLEKSKNLIVCVFGDGAIEEGVYHESLNFAALHKLPMIFILENNELAVHSKISERQSFNPGVHAKSFGLKVTEIIDCYDPIEIQNILEQIYSDVRKKCMPQWVSIQTFRYMEHVGTGMDFDAGYRNKVEYEKLLKNDVFNKKNFSYSELLQINLDIEAAVNFAIKSPWPIETELFQDVY